MKTLFKISTLLPVALLLVFATTVKAQDENIGSMLKEQRFVFKAETAIPTGLASRALSYGYDLRLNGTNVKAYLPYFGIANMAPVNPADNALQFTSTKYDYSISNRKDGWEVTIRPNDAVDVRDMQLTVFSNGRATLQVNSTRRSPISFSGSVEGL